MSPSMPRIVTDALPERERALGASIQNGLYDLDRYIGNFEQALTLFDFSRSQRTGRQNQSRADLQTANRLDIRPGWVFVAARDGAMSIYHFLCAMEGAKMCIHRCETLKTSFDKNISKSASKLFDECFPHCIQLRHSIAHQAELTESPEKQTSNSFSGDFEDGGIKLINVKNVMISDYLNNNEYKSTINGNIVSYKINSDTMQSLLLIRNKFYEAFLSSDLVSRPSAGFI